MAKPPKSRRGRTEASAGRPIVAGVAPFQRELSARATSADLWASLDALAADPSRLRETHQSSIDASARMRFTAYIEQAKEYYSAVAGMEPAAKPLIAYYFTLNLTKAFLTAVDPLTTSAELYHGLTPDPEHKQRYRFAQEGFKIKQDGVLRLLAERTGQGHCWSKDYRIQLKKALAYVPEGFDQYADAYGKHPRLIPVVEVSVLFGETEAGKAAWLRTEVSRNVLSQRKLGPEKLLTEAKAFGQRFRLVDDPGRPDCASYESRDSYPYHRRSDALPAIGKLYDATLLVAQRYRRGSPKYIVQSVRPQLLSNEALTFAVMHHLSDMVRYRPERVAQLRGSRDYWVFASWVDRACENFLLGMASRIAGEEHSVG